MNVSKIGCLFAFCALELFNCAFALELQNRFSTREVDHQSVVKARFHKIGFKLPGKFHTQIRAESKPLFSERHNGILEYPRLGLTLNPSDNSFLQTAKAKLATIKSYAGYDIDGMRVNLRAPGLKPSLLIENLDSENSSDFLSFFESLEIEEDNIQLKIEKSF